MPRKIPPGKKVTISQPLNKYNDSVNPTKPNKGFPNRVDGDRLFLRFSANASSVEVEIKKYSRAINSYCWSVGQPLMPGIIPFTHLSVDKF